MWQSSLEDELAGYLGVELVPTLSALIDTLIPPDEFPGGWDSGVGGYFALGFGRQFASHVDLYNTCLAALDTDAQVRQGKPFAELDLPARTRFLQELEQEGIRDGWPESPRQFVRTAAEHAAEGYYSDPGNGGNANGISWKMIGFEVKG